MTRFFIAGCSLPKGGTVFLTGEDAEHAKVLRLRVGEHIVICDGQSTDRRCVIRRVRDGDVEVQVEEVTPCAAEPTVAVKVLAGLPKQGERADYLVQKCTECGASEIIFFQSHRCVARPEGQAMEKKLARWQRIAQEAAKQSGRGVIPAVGSVEDFAGALDAAVKTELPLFFYETGERQPLKQVLEAAGEIRSAAIITGPEGGFELFEADLAARLGFRVCSMGPRILRCETAPVAALNALMYATGNY